jgi:hypothetical protein
MIRCVLSAPSRSLSGASEFADTKHASKSGSIVKSSTLEIGVVGAQLTS